MKILLLGELSGVHQELAPGLRALGHEVVVAHSRLANPDFKSDIPFYRAPTGATGAKVWIRDIISQLGHATRLTGFDIVQIITPKFFNWKIHEAMLRFLKRYNRKLVVIATSCSSDYYRRVRELAYRPCKECLALDQVSGRCPYSTPDEQRAEHQAFELADAIVATAFEYAFALSDTPFAPKIVGIPLPVDLGHHPASPMQSGEKVRIWYGETRRGIKGGPFIVKALDWIETGDLAGEVQVYRTGRLALEDYRAMLDNVHIVIDQASVYSSGMNALYSLAKGRVTLSGAEPDALNFLKVPEVDNPVVNIRPDAEQIYAALAGLIKRKDELPELGRRSAAYVAKYHASDVIARQYEALYARLLQPVSESVMEA